LARANYQYEKRRKELAKKKKKEEKRQRKMEKGTKQPKEDLEQWNQIPPGLHPRISRLNV
jgi:hypothetical protein